MRAPVQQTAMPFGTSKLFAAVLAGEKQAQSFFKNASCEVREDRAVITSQRGSLLPFQVREMTVWQLVNGQAQQVYAEVRMHGNELHVITGYPVPEGLFVFEPTLIDGDTFEITKARATGSHNAYPLAA